MANIIHDIGVASQIGKYSDAVETVQADRVSFLSGNPGLTPDGRLPETFEEQADRPGRTCWRCFSKQT
jgi:enamine deaminase RidA (YjgF/YER057c/UK114 family)